MKCLGISTAALMTSSFNLNCQRQKSHPNIVYILADDMGYGDCSCLNKNSKIKTTHIDQLAAGGMIFSDAHSGSAVCTPTRYGILTGRYSWRSKLKKGVLWGYDTPLLETGRMTVASLLKTHGYHTACIGKWHLGIRWPRRSDKKEDIDYTKEIPETATKNGFDYFFGIPASLDMPPYVYIKNNRLTAVPERTTVNEDAKGFWRAGPTGADFDHEQVLPKLTEKAVDYIHEQAKNPNPFFLYFPLPAPHTPILPTKPFQGKSNTNAYGDFVLQVDDVVGRIISALKEEQLFDDTLVIFTSDNGCSPRADFAELAAVRHHPSYHFRGHKADIYEGGHRIPFIASWPVRIKAATVSDETICLTDLLATCAAVAGTTLPDNAGEDSYNILPALLAKSQPGPIREAIVHHSINGSFAIRQGRWKLEMCPGSGGWSYPKPGLDDMSDLPSVQLYDLENDIGEQQNVCQQYPDVVDELTKLLTRYIKNELTWMVK
jgi:arylsulfatase A-like enzyme